MDLSTIDFDSWMELGLRRGFVGPPVCYTHDCVPTTEEEDTMMEQGDDPCIHVIRPYRSEEEKKNVESNHSPSVWRNPLTYGE